MSDIIKTVLLTALPASGKSEVRNYLDNLSPQQCQEQFHMGQTVQLDDYPYVHFMRCVDDALADLGKERVFFKAPDKNFSNPYEWGTLIHLLNEDYRNLFEKRAQVPPSPARWLFYRIDMARGKVGQDSIFDKIPHGIQHKLADALEDEARKIQQGLADAIPETLTDKTIVIEFARGGKDGAEMPLSTPFGYQYSLSQLSPAILKDAALLYIWVTPEESRRKNDHRADPNDPGSILHHGVPLYVMLNDYGCDDMDYLLSQSGREHTIKVERDGQSFFLPVGRFDNRKDLTTFLRDDPSEWPAEALEAIRSELNTAFSHLWQQYKALHG
jgi:hypothetical protein